MPNVERPSRFGGSRSRGGEPLSLSRSSQKNTPSTFCGWQFDILRFTLARRSAAALGRGWPLQSDEPATKFPEELQKKAGPPGDPAFDSIFLNCPPDFMSPPLNGTSPHVAAFFSKLLSPVLPVRGHSRPGRRTNRPYHSNRPARHNNDGDDDHDSHNRYRSVELGGHSTRRRGLPRRSSEPPLGNACHRGSPSLLPLPSGRP